MTRDAKDYPLTILVDRVADAQQALNNHDRAMATYATVRAQLERSLVDAKENLSAARAHQGPTEGGCQYDRGHDGQFCGLPGTTNDPTRCRLHFGM